MKNLLNKIFATILITLLGVTLALPSFVYAEGIGIDTTGIGGSVGGITGGGSVGIDTSGITGGISTDSLSGAGGGLLSIAGGLTGLLSGSVFVPTGTVLDAPRTGEEILKSVIVGISRMLIHQLTEQIVNLIRTGGQGGGALFVQDWQGFLLDAADQASGAFLEELKATQLCQPFAVNIRLLLSDGSSPFSQRARCTISDMLNNVQNFYQNFSQGGWSRWFEITQVPQNNFYGAYYLAREQKLISEAAAVNASYNEAISANGFIGVKDQNCTTQEEDVGDTPDGPFAGGTVKDGVLTKKVCVPVIVSPGKYLENRLADATSDDIRQLGLAQSFNEIILAAFQTLIQNIFFSQSGLAGANSYSPSITNQFSTDLSSLQQTYLQVSGVTQAIDTAQGIIAAKNNSLGTANDILQILNQLKTCETGKSQPASATDSLIANTTFTITTLNQDIFNENVLLQTLQNDRQAILIAGTANDLQIVFQKTQSDVVKTGSQTGAESQTNQLVQVKSQVASDLASCTIPTL